MTEFKTPFEHIHEVLVGVFFGVIVGMVLSLIIVGIREIIVDDSPITLTVNLDIDEPLEHY